MKTERSIYKVGRVLRLAWDRPGIASLFARGTYAHTYREAHPLRKRARPFLPLHGRAGCAGVPAERTGTLRARYPPGHLAGGGDRDMGVPEPRLPGLQTGALALLTFEPTSA
jgi:hypothetical protein